MLREQVKKVVDSYLLKHVHQFFEEFKNNDEVPFNLALKECAFTFFVEENKKLVEYRLEIRQYSNMQPQQNTE